MAQQKESVIRILLVEDRIEDAEQLSSVLRNGGIAVRPQRPESLEELAKLAAEQPIDLVMISKAGRQIPFDAAVEAVNASGKDLPIIAVVDALDEATVLGAIAVGTRAALRGRPEHFQWVVRNEFASLQARRGLRRLEAALRETERRCDSLISSSRDPIAYIHEGMHIRANEAYLEMFGFTEFEEIEGLSVLDLVAPAHAASFKDLLKRLSRGEAPPKSLQLAAQRGDGSTFDAVMEFAQASWEGEPCLQVVFRQQAIDQEMVRELDELRQRDQVTALFNRPYFLAELEEAVGRAAQGSGQQAMLLVEPDHYAALLGDIGLAHADELLQCMAARLLESAPGDDLLVARFSDHTFAVLCRDADHARTLQVAEAIRAGFDGHIMEVGERSMSVNVSLGGVQIGEKIASVQQVLAKAASCLQSAVGVGGNRFEIFDPSARDRAEEERIKAWVERIRGALATEGFQLHYQPIISLGGDPGETYEAFLRMRVGQGEVVPPLSFLGIAEEHGLLDEIDRWVIGRAIAVIAERQAKGKTTTLFVKVTPASLMEGHLHDYIGEQLKAHGVPGERLVLEIPEAKVFTNLKAAQSFQHAIATHGCRIALEQFGSGLNSFQLLQHLDPAFLKIDRAFIADLAKNAENQKKVREIAEAARTAGKLTVAEFVQDAGSMTVLFGSGVDYVEGHFLAPAGPEMTYDFG